MTVVRRFHPLSEAFTLHDAMNQLFAQSFVQPDWSSGRSPSLAAPVDVFEIDQTYHVHVFLPVELARKNGDSKVENVSISNGIGCSKATGLTYSHVECVNACAILRTRHV